MTPNIIQTRRQIIDNFKATLFLLVQVHLRVAYKKNNFKTEYALFTSIYTLSKKDRITLPELFVSFLLSIILYWALHNLTSHLEFCSGIIC